MMAFNNAEFQSAFLDILAKNVAALLDARLDLMERELEYGWRCYHPREVWFKENLPPPPLNEPGKRYMREKLLVEIYRDPQSAHFNHPGELESSYTSEFLQEFSTSARARAGYRNFLDVGVLDAEANEYCPPAPFDLVANEVTSDLLKANRHHLREIADIHYIGRYAVRQWATRTPPYHVYGQDKFTGVRNEELPLAQDRGYWDGVYARDWGFLGEAVGLLDASWILKLMAELAPEFPYCAALSTRARMVFMREGGAPVAWAMIVEKIAGFPEFNFPPPLVLCPRGLARKYKHGDTLFNNPLRVDVNMMSDRAPRDVELHLLYLLPRYRRLIEFYEPFVLQALAAV
jgi:hypothetical protein